MLSTPRWETANPAPRATKVVDLGDGYTTIRFQPGALHIMLDSHTGCVSTLCDGQAKNAGVLPGWTLYKVDGEEYSPELLRDKYGGTLTRNVAWTAIFDTSSGREISEPEQIDSIEAVSDNVSDTTESRERRIADLEKQLEERDRLLQEMQMDSFGITIASLVAELHQTRECLHEQERKQENALLELEAGRPAEAARLLMSSKEDLEVVANYPILGTAFELTKRVCVHAESYPVLGGAVRLGGSVAGSLVGKAFGIGSDKLSDQTSRTLNQVDKSVITPLVDGYRRSGRAIFQSVRRVSSESALVNSEPESECPPRN